MGFPRAVLALLSSEAGVKLVWASSVAGAIWPAVLISGWTAGGCGLDDISRSLALPSILFSIEALSSGSIVIIPFYLTAEDTEDAEVRGVYKVKILCTPRHQAVF